ncbi:sigma factor [Nonomuraea sp. NPDC047529]|uniref:RNA polymerase sigma factor n=1 Tax=Nonomuraea sp. NPDC047529 TaxID=3155623 RepID=UPI0034103C8B
MTAPLHAAPPGEETDAQLIGASRQDPDRFGVVFDRYFARIHRFIDLRLGTSAADDLAAETFLHAFRSRDRFDLTSPSARPWLYGIASNLVAEHRRAEARRYRAPARSTEGTEIDGHDEHGPPRTERSRDRPGPRRVPRSSSTSTRRPSPGAPVPRANTPRTCVASCGCRAGTPTRL